MTPYEFRRSLTEEQLAFYEAEIRRAFNLEERYYRECAELRQINRALLCLLTQMEKKMKSDRRKIRGILRCAQDDREGGVKDEGFTLQGIP
ncbi:MAG: hypothetical protein IJT62_05690 [Oscillospiraceae bacterium]|nr:hypothetical protein [Oscillospiraceae bacterium]